MKIAKTYLGRWYQYRMMPAVYTTEAPQGKAEAWVRIQTESDVSGRIQFARQLHGAAQRGDRRMRHLNAREHARRRNAKIQIGQHLRGGRSIHYWQLLLWHVVHIQNQRPAFYVDHVVRLLYEITCNRWFHVRFTNDIFIEIFSVTFVFSNLRRFWLVKTRTDLLTSTIMRTVGKVVCRFCGWGGLMVTGTAPTYKQP